MKTQAKCRPLSHLNIPVYMFKGGFCAYVISNKISSAGLNNNVKFSHDAFLLFLLIRSLFWIVIVLIRGYIFFNPSLQGRERIV